MRRLRAIDANHTGVRDDVFGFGISTTNPHSGLFVVSRMTDESGTLVSATAQAEDFQFSTGVQNAHTLVLFKYADIGPEYNPIDGYLTENDMRGPQFFYQYSGSGRKGRGDQVVSGACGLRSLCGSQRRGASGRRILES